MREGVVEAEDHGQFVREAFLGVLEELVKAGSAAREHHKLHVQRHDSVKRLRQQIRTLLRRHPRYHPRQRGLKAVLQLQLFTQIVETQLLTRSLVRRIALADELIRS